MKKLIRLTFALLFLFSLSASAQITKGTVLLGGGISGDHSKSELSGSEEKTSSFSFSPAIGVAIKDNAVIGVRFIYAHSKVEQTNGTSTSTQTQNGFNPGVFYRRYAALGKKFYLFGEANASYTHAKAETDNGASNPNSTQTINGGAISFYPGVAFAVSRKIHLEAGLNNLFQFSYASSKTETTYAGTTNTSKNSSFSFNTNVSTSAPLTVGFRFVLGK